MGESNVQGVQRPSPEAIKQAKANIGDYGTGGPEETRGVSGKGLVHEGWTYTRVCPKDAQRCPAGLLRNQR